MVIWCLRILGFLEPLINKVKDLGINLIFGFIEDIKGMLEELKVVGVGKALGGVAGVDTALEVSGGIENSRLVGHDKCVRRDNFWVVRSRNCCLVFGSRISILGLIPGLILIRALVSNEWVLILYPPPQIC
jgi:hypothetical protein